MATEISMDNLGQDYHADDEDIAQMFKNQPGEGDDIQLPDDSAKPEPQQKDPDPDDKSGGASDDLDDLDDDDDARRGGKSQEELEATTPEAAAAAREKKRTDRLNQRQRQRAKIETLERNLANALASNQEVMQRLSQLENTNISSHAASLDGRLQQMATVEEQLKSIIADATVKGDGVRVAEATQAMIQLQAEKANTIGMRQHIEQQVRQPRQQQMLDNETVALARSFIDEHPWYKGPKSTDTDSQIMATLDNALTKEGWNPRSPSYWAELKKRAAVYLPHRFTGKPTMPNDNDQGHNADQQPRRTVKQPVAGSGSNSTPSKGSETYRISDQRVRAMKEAGIWDDLPRRQKMIRRYQQADKEAEQNR